MLELTGCFKIDMEKEINAQYKYLHKNFLSYYLFKKTLNRLPSFFDELLEIYH